MRRIQPSLRDLGNTELRLPNVETLGYCRSSLRDFTATGIFRRTQCGFSGAKPRIPLETSFSDDAVPDSWAGHGICFTRKKQMPAEGVLPVQLVVAPVARIFPVMS